MNPPSCDDRRRDFATESLFAVLAKHFFHCCCVGLIHKVAGRLTDAYVEPHIERSIERIPEASLTIRELIGRQTEVQQDAIDRANRQLIQDLSGFRITRLLKKTLRPRNLLGGMRQHHRIAIEPNQDSVRTNALSDLTTMATGTDSPVQHRQSRSQLKLLQDFSEHDRNVTRRSQWNLGG